jgi:hypothetical protein
MLICVFKFLSKKKPPKSMGGFKYIFTYIYTNPFSYVIITMTLKIKIRLITFFIFVFLTLQKYIKQIQQKNILSTNREFLVK